MTRNVLRWEGQQLHAFLPEQSDPRLRRRQYAPHAAGIEATLAQGIAHGGLRQARYIGLAKTALQEILMAVALNLVRLIAWWQETPRASIRHSHFATLAPSG